jgi:hypothetical protein
VNFYTKTPAEVLDYGFDWSAWLDGDTIVSSEWTVPSGLTAGESNFSLTETVVWISGGRPSVEYMVANRIWTVGGKTKERFLTIQVKEAL